MEFLKAWESNLSYDQGRTRNLRHDKALGFKRARQR